MNHSNPLISVIVPVFNQEEYLRQCVESVLAQTYSRWELILVNDGSTDGSENICREYAASDSRIKTIHRPNGGLSAARNEGLDIASGEYITFLDADDLLHPAMLSVLTNAATGQRVDMAICGIKNFASQKNTAQSCLPNYESPVAKDTYSSLYTPEHAVSEMLYQKDISASACGKFFHRSIWSESRFREGIGYEDLDIIPIVTMKASAIAACQTPLYFYRQHSESYTHRFSLRRADVLEVASRVASYMEENYPALEKAARDRELSANFNIFGIISANMSRLSGAESREASIITGRCWKKIKELRRQSLCNPHVRLKNKIGIIASYLGGKAMLRLLSSRVYRPADK